MPTTFVPITDTALANEYLAAKLLWHRRTRYGVTPQEWVPDTMYDMPISKDSWSVYEFAIAQED